MPSDDNSGGGHVFCRGRKHMDHSPTEMYEVTEMLGAEPVTFHHCPHCRVEVEVRDGD